MTGASSPPASVVVSHTLTPAACLQLGMLPDGFLLVHLQDDAWQFTSSSTWQLRSKQLEDYIAL